MIAPRRRIFPRLYATGILVILSVLLIAGGAGCSPVTRPVQTAALTEIVINSETSAGQTFVANFNGLEGIRLRLSPRTPGQGEIILHLRSSALETGDITTARLPISSLTAPSYYTFTFPPQSDSRRKSYYAVLEVTGSGEAAVSSAGANAYLDGAAYLNGTPQEEQLAFMLVHDPALLAGGLAQTGLEWAGMLLAAAALFILPGWALLAWLYPRWSELDWIEKTCLAPGASLAVYPLLMLFTGMAGLQLGRAYAIAPPLAAAIYLIWRQRRTPRRDARPVSRKAVSGFLPDAAFVLVVTALVITRLWPIHGLDAPMWGDSYQHSLIAQLLVNQGGLFRSWEPYLPLSTFTYHFGFHAAVAELYWVTGEAITGLTLWAGQLLNILAVVALAPISMRISRSRWAAPLTVLAAGLLTSMPAFYINWGRYTQLAGQVVLPAFVFCLWSALRDRDAGRRTALLAGLLAAGLALNHYVILILAVIFSILAFPFALRKGWIAEPFLRLALAGCAGGLLFLPRFVQVFDGTLMAFTGAMYTSAGAAPAVMPAIEWTTYLPGYLWILSLGALAWAILARKRLGILTGLWWVLALALANPARLGLPFRGALSSFAVLIGLYIPAAILTGAAAGWIVDQLASLSARVHLPRRAAGWTSLLIIAIICVPASQMRLDDPQPALHALLTRPDIQAMAWIQQNTDPSSVFLVESKLAYGSTLTAGTDGGWWLAYLAERASTQPPLNYAQEQSTVPGYYDQVHDITAAMVSKGIADPETQNLLQEFGVTHVYIGQLQGASNTDRPSVTPQELLELGWARPVYHQDRVWVFELDWGQR